jgi:hypothetical protein
MDCTAYQMLRAPTPEDVKWHDDDKWGRAKEVDFDTRELLLLPGQHAELNELIGCELAGTPRQYINVEKMEQDFNIPKDYNFGFGEGDLDSDEGWVVFHSPLPGKPSIRKTLKTADYLYSDGLSHVLVVLKRQGYLRKPFRLSEDGAIERTADGALSLTANNFGGADEAAIRALLGERAFKDSYVALTHRQLSIATELEPHTCNPLAWREVVVKALESPKGLVVIDW